MSKIHPTAIVDDTAVLGEGTTVGPFTVIGERARIGEGNQIGPYVIIDEGAEIGAENQIHAGAVLGAPAQDKKACEGETRLIVGNRNVVREYVTFHRGTDHGGGVTRIGNDGVFETFAHVGHDSWIGDGVRLGPMTGISGHVTIEDGAETGAHVGIHQFVRLGKHSRCDDYSGVVKDAPPYCVSAGSPADVLRLREDLVEALGLSPEAVAALTQAFTVLTQTRAFAQVLDRLSETPLTEETGALLSFLREEGHRFPERRRGILRKAKT